MWISGYKHNVVRTNALRDCQADDEIVQKGLGEQIGRAAEEMEQRVIDPCQR